MAKHEAAESIREKLSAAIVEHARQSEFIGVRLGVFAKLREQRRIIARLTKRLNAAVARASGALPVPPETP